MQESSSENQSADRCSEEKFAKMSERELNFLLESRQSRTAKKFNIYGCLYF